MSKKRPVAVELFAGIGGFSAAVDGHADVAAALDLSPHTLEALRLNFPGVHAIQKNIEQLTPAQMSAYDADIWWMSPPCQPYTVRGHQHDLEDRRARSLVHMLTLIDAVRPEHVAMENVRGFWDSQARQRVLDVLHEANYEVREQIVCPSTLGVPARRERYYLVASRSGLIPEHELDDVDWPCHHLAHYLDAPEEVSSTLYVSEADQQKFAHAMRIFERDDEAASLNCFTSAYGKTFRYSGAFLREEDGRVRYFSPAELLRLLHFPRSYTFPEAMSRRQRYKYIGNSLSVRAMREVLRALPLLRDVASGVTGENRALLSHGG